MRHNLPGRTMCACITTCCIYHAADPFFRQRTAYFPAITDRFKKPLAEGAFFFACHIGRTSPADWPSERKYFKANRWEKSKVGRKANMVNPLYQKHIISINDLTREDLELALQVAASLKAKPQPELLKVVKT
ncbi:MAG: hypothetical protein ACR5LF_12225 [Symbiopectobacterium sp.]